MASKRDPGADSRCHDETVHAALCLAHRSTALTPKHTRDSGKKNSWIHVWIFRKEECLLVATFSGCSSVDLNRARLRQFKRRHRAQNITHTDTLTAYLLVKLKNVSRFKISEFSKN